MPFMNSWDLFEFSVALRPQRPYGHLDFPARLLGSERYSSSSNVALRPQRQYGTIMDGGAQDVHPDFHTAPEL